MNGPAAAGARQWVWAHYVNFFSMEHRATDICSQPLLVPTSTPALNTDSHFRRFATMDSMQPWLLLKN